jgi:catechol 2,3-dioxygenase-like lactoylglutathione lyase family enzyme
MTLRIDALDHIVLNVGDVEASAAWYQTVLGMRREDSAPGHGRPSRTAIMFGQQKINLRPVDADRVEWFTGAHPTAGSDDLCLLTNEEPTAVVAHLQACGVAIEEGPTPRQGARGTLRSVYCRDPDGNLIEISSYDV